MVLICQVDLSIALPEVLVLSLTEACIITRTFAIYWGANIMGRLTDVTTHTLRHADRVIHF